MCIRDRDRLSLEKKGGHQLFDCNACLGDPNWKKALGLFFIPQKFVKDAEKNGTVLTSLQASKKASKGGAVAAKQYVEERIPPTYLKQYNTLIASNAVKAINKSYKKTSVSRYFGGKVSCNKLAKLRMEQQFEPNVDAHERTVKNRDDIIAGHKRPHDHVGRMEKFSWRATECLNYVNQLEEGSWLNFSNLARMFDLKEKDNFGKDNYNQVVRKFLEDSGVDLNRFKYHKKIDDDQYHVRRAKAKFDLPNTSRKISGPTDPCLGNVKVLLNELILNGTYDMGQLIAPIEFFRVICSAVMK